MRERVRRLVRLSEHLDYEPKSDQSLKLGNLALHVLEEAVGSGLLQEQISRRIEEDRYKWVA